MNDGEPDARIRFLLKLRLLVRFDCRAAALPGKSLGLHYVVRMDCGSYHDCWLHGEDHARSPTFTKDLRQIYDDDQLSIVVIVVPEENGSITRQRNTLN